jgi:hypothetical protein
LVALGRPARRGCWTTEPDWGRRGYGIGTEGGRRLPKPDYYLDESDPDVLVLRRRDGTFVAALSAQGASREAAVEDYAKSIEADAEALGVREDGRRKRSA